MIRSDGGGLFEDFRPGEILDLGGDEVEAEDGTVFKVEVRASVDVEDPEGWREFFEGYPFEGRGVREIEGQEGIGQGCVGREGLEAVAAAGVKGAQGGAAGDARDISEIRALDQGQIAKGRARSEFL